MKEYRTKEQFDEMVENMTNGNWTDAGRNGVDYGFYANDIVKMLEENEEYDGLEHKDFIYLVEIICETRAKDNLKENK